MDQTKSNPRAASVRVLSRKASGYKGQRMHDLRRGKQPAYVNGDLAHLNRTLIEPPTPGALSKICAERRNNRKTRRAMKSGTNVAFIGIITFGAEAQILFRALKPEEQNAAYLEVAQAIADRLNTTLEGLVIHNDETSPHAHLTFPAYDLDGLPLTKSAKRGALLGIQDDLGEIMGRHAPGIERGRSREARIAAGADVADTINRSVRELHADLPAEIEAKRVELDQAAGRVDEMEGRVAKLKAQADLTDKEAKRLEVYEKRLADRIAELESAQQEAARLADLSRIEAEDAQQARDDAKALEVAARANAETAQKARDLAQADETAARERAGRITAAFTVLKDEIDGDTISRNEAGRITVKNPDGLRQGYPDIKPAVNAVADAMTAKTQAKVSALVDREKAAAELRDAESIKSENLTLRERLTSAIKAIKSLARLKGLLGPDANKVKEVVKDAEALLTPSIEKPIKDTDPDGFTI